MMKEMKKMLAVELIGTIDEKFQIHLDEDISFVRPGKVRIIIFFPEEMMDIDEKEWLRSAAKNPVFDFLYSPDEDIYTLNDGKPFNDKG